MSEKKPPLSASNLPQHESAVRRLVADAEGTAYHALESLAQARTFSDAVVTFEGDYGGQIYVVAPIHLVQCDELSLNRLLAELDALEWNDEKAASVFYERRTAGEEIVGGMGGAVVLPTVWVHERLQQRYSAVVAVLSGKSSTIHQ